MRTKVKLISENGVFILDLEDNPTSRAFVAQLPLEIKIEDYASNE